VTDYKQKNKFIGVAMIFPFFLGGGGRGGGGCYKKVIQNPKKEERNKIVYLKLEILNYA